VAHRRCTRTSVEEGRFIRRINLEIKSDEFYKDLKSRVQVRLALNVIKSIDKLNIKSEI
jgi:hypothetical protein